jgi:hypothetical protein
MESLQSVFDWLGNFDTLVSVVAMIFSVLTWNNLQKRNKRYQELVKREAPVTDFDERVRINEGIKSSHPMALALALTPNVNEESMKKDIKNFFKENAAIPEIECIDFNGINNAEDRKKLVTELRAMRRKLGEEGCTELHLFIAGPGAAASLAGAIFDNWIPVKLYAAPPNKTAGILYEYWMPLDIVKGS